MGFKNKRVGDETGNKLCLLLVKAAISHTSILMSHENIRGGIRGGKKLPKNRLKCTRRRRRFCLGKFCSFFRWVFFLFFFHSFLFSMLPHRFDEVSFLISQRPYAPFPSLFSPPLKINFNKRVHSPPSWDLFFHRLLVSWLFFLLAYKIHFIVSFSFKLNSTRKRWRK